MIRLQVFFKTHARPAPHLVWEIIEFPFKSIQQVLDALSDGVMIDAQAIRSSPTENRLEREIDLRKPLLFRGSAVDRVDMCPFIMVEKEDR